MLFMQSTGSLLGDGGIFRKQFGPLLLQDILAHVSLRMTWKTVTQILISNKNNSRKQAQK